ncbi:MAG: pyridoxamine 5'-phosphate oxidase family protein [Pseudomonadales bacterium]
MTDFYTPAQRHLQDEFETRELADRLVEAVITESLSEPQIAFIAAQNMFFLSTVDEQGFPTVSYKGGAPGFVRALNPQTLVFPSYDGNGMFMSMGNIESQAKVGMLFIDFQTPQRARVRGSARLLREGPLLASYPGADLVVELAVERAWVNCPRYVHPMQPMSQSPYVPREDGSVKLALWKRIDLMQDVLNAADRAEAQALGLITAQEYEQRVGGGELG